jgi:chromosome segregation ATPase
VSILLPQPHDGPSETVRLRQRIESLHRLLNSAEAARRLLERERDLARWQVILDRNKIAAREAESEALRAQVTALAGEAEELRARLAERSASDVRDTIT